MVKEAQGRPTRFPERVAMRVPPGWRHRIAEAAEDVGMNTPEWLRFVVRHALEAAERKQRTGGAS